MNSPGAGEQGYIKTQHLIRPNHFDSINSNGSLSSTGSMKPLMWANTELKAVDAKFHHSASVRNISESDSFPPGSRASKQQAAPELLNGWVTASRDVQMTPRASRRRWLWSRETGYWMEVSGVMKWWPQLPSHWSCGGLWKLGVGNRWAFQNKLWKLVSTKCGWKGWSASAGTSQHATRWYWSGIMFQFKAPCAKNMHKSEIATLHYSLVEKHLHIS